MADFAEMFKRDAKYEGKTYGQCFDFPEDPEEVEELTQQLHTFVAERVSVFPNLAFNFMNDMNYKKLLMSILMLGTHEELLDVIMMFFEAGFISGARFGQERATRDGSLKKLLKDVQTEQP